MTGLRLVLVLGVMALLPALPAWATHNRAGEIHIEQIGACSDLTVRATIITYTKASAFAADRDSLEIFWGDGTKEWVYRVNGPSGGSGFPNGEVLANDVKKNLYVATHAYPARATYRVSMLDPNRVDGILNVNFPNSVTVTFYIETVYTFLNPQFQGCNSTPQLLQPPIDFGCVGRPFIHNPNAFDPDGDSLSYHLIQPLQSAGIPVPKYLFPNQIGSGGPNTVTLDPVSGDLRWINPLTPGEYNIAFIIISYRNGVALDTTIRDMQVLVSSCENAPPVIQAEEEVCVIAGTTLDLPVVATDPDAGQQLLLTATGGPFVNPLSTAVFQAPANYSNPPVNGRLLWPTACEEIRRQPWSIVFRAVDNDANTPLADLHTLRVTVVGPPPEDVQASTAQNLIRLSWESPYACEQTEEDYFRGFSVWRRIGSNPFLPDTCDPGLEGKGYTRIAFRQTTLENGRYVFSDTNVEPGRTYCYRIVADFARLSAAGNPFNQVSGLPSAEICVQLQRNVPLLTRVSVHQTDETNGAMEVVWTKPRIPDLDTILYPGPYRYQLFRSPGLGTDDWEPVPGADFTAPSYSAANDTSLQFDTGLDTRNLGHTYQVLFSANGSDIGASATASSVYLTVAATDRRNNLAWSETVPWVNDHYQVERQDPISGDWLLIGLTEVPVWVDTGLVNGTSYCYRIRSSGDYGIADLPAPLLNLSQEACGIPLDTVPPCSPILTVTNICDTLIPGEDPNLLLNRLKWSDPRIQCPGLSDVAGYTVYLREPGQAGASPLTTLLAAGDTFFLHYPERNLAGCYSVVAFDALGNASVPSAEVCVDNCPDYRLPNTFTPNNDGQNDLFRPYPYRFVERVDFQVFNRWGNLVFHTSDPDLLWDGTDDNGKALADGVYAYVCTVFELRLEGVVAAGPPLKGFIQLIRN